MTPFLQVHPQRTKADCAVACLAMFLGKSYEEVLIVAPHRVLKSGMEIRHVKQTAKKLGATLRLHRTFDPETDSGLLGVRSKKWPLEHLVVLWNGSIVDTDATLWEYDVFMKAYKAQPISLLVRA